MAREDESELEQISVESMYGMNTQKPIVKMTFRNIEVQLSPEDARSVAFNLLQGAEGAEFDAAIMRLDLPLQAKAATVRLRRSAHGR